MLIIVREMGLIKSLRYFFKNLSDYSTATFGFDSVPGAHVFPLDTQNGKIMQWIIKNRFTKVIFLSNQSAVLSDAQLANELNKQGVETISQSTEAGYIGSDKIRMKNFFQLNAFQTSNFFSTQKASKAISMADTTIFPLIAKKPRLSDGRGMAYINSQADIESYFYEQVPESPVLFEQFIEGTEASTIVYYNFGNPVVFPVVVKPSTHYLQSNSRSVRERVYVIVNALISRRIQKRIQDLALQVAHKAQNRYLLGIDVVIDKKNNISLLEMNPRVTETLRMSMVATNCNVFSSMAVSKPIQQSNPYLRSNNVTVDVPLSFGEKKIISIFKQKPLYKVEGAHRTSYQFDSLVIPKEIISNLL